MTEIYDNHFLAFHKNRRKKLHPLTKRAEKRLYERLADLKKECFHKISCFGLQFTNNLEADLRQIYEDLPRGGLFLGVMAGGDSLQELKDCLKDAEMEVSQIVAQRVAPMIGLEELAKLLSRVGFMHTAGDLERFNLIYSDMIMLMRDLRASGFANALMERPRHFTKRRIFSRAHELYEQRFPAPPPTTEGIVATMDLLYMHGWKE